MDLLLNQVFMNNRCIKQWRYTIDYYVFWEWIKIFCLSLGVTTGLLLIEDIYDNLPDLIAQQATYQEIALYYGGAIPSFLPAILPLALMVSILFVLGQLHRNQEIIALKAAGLSLFQITRSLILAGGCIALLMLYLNAVWVPWSVEHTRELMTRLKIEHATDDQSAPLAGIISPLSYQSLDQQRIWVMSQFDERTNQALSINLYDLNNPNDTQRQILAEEAFFDDAQGHWVFLNGRDILLKNNDPIQSIYFERLSTPSYTDQPDLMLLMHQNSEDLSFWELQYLLAHHSSPISERLRPYAIRYYEVLASPLMVWIIVFLAIPLAVRGVRTSPMVGVSKCVGLFLLYYFLHEIILVLAEHGYLFPIIAAWLPGLLMLAFATYLYRQEM